MDDELPVRSRLVGDGRAEGGGGGALDQFAGEVEHHVVVGEGLVGLQHRELGVVLVGDALVAEGAAHLEDLLHTADAEPLEVELGRDAQVQVEVVGVDVGAEGPGVGTAVDLLEHRGLDLQVAAVEQSLAQGLDRAGAGPYDVPCLGARDEVEVAAPDPGLGVGEALALVGEGAQALAGELPGADHEGRLARPAGAGLAADEHVVAEVDLGGEGVQHLGPGLVAGEHQLDVAGPVAQDGEDHAAEVAYEHHAPGEGGLFAGPGTGREGGAAGGALVGGLQFRDGVGARADPHRVGVGTGRPDAVQFRVADADLFGQPLGRGPRVPLLDRVQAQGFDGGQSLGGGDGGEALGMAVAPQGAQAGYGDEALGDAGGEADPGEQ